MIDNIFLALNKKYLGIGLKVIDVFIIAQIEEFQRSGSECYLTNAQFSQLFGESDSTIKRSLNKLCKLNIIRRQTHFVQNNGNSKKQRILYVNAYENWKVPKKPGMYNKIKRILDVPQKCEDLSEYTNLYIQAYLSPLNKWPNNFKLNERIKIIEDQKSIDENIVAKYIKQMEYSEFLSTPYWHTISDHMKQISKHKCQICGAKSNLNVHHSTYDNHGYEHRSSVMKSDLIVLCQDCHEKIHGINKLTGQN